MVAEVEAEVEEEEEDVVGGVAMETIKGRMVDIITMVEEVDEAEAGVIVVRDMEGAGVDSKLGAEVMVVAVEGWAEEEVVDTRHKFEMVCLNALKAKQFYLMLYQKEVSVLLSWRMNCVGNLFIVCWFPILWMCQGFLSVGCPFSPKEPYVGSCFCTIHVTAFL